MNAQTTVRNRYTLQRLGDTTMLDTAARQALGTMASELGTEGNPSGTARQRAAFALAQLAYLLVDLPTLETDDERHGARKVLERTATDAVLSGELALRSYTAARDDSLTGGNPERQAQAARRAGLHYGRYRAARALGGFLQALRNALQTGNVPCVTCSDTGYAHGDTPCEDCTLGQSLWDARQK